MNVPVGPGLSIASTVPTSEVVAEITEPDTEQEPEQEPEPETGSREAAKYRKQLRTAEAERDQLRTGLDNLRRAEVGRQAEAAGIKTAALWASGATLENLLGEDGTPDNARILEAVAVARDQLGLYKIPAAPSAYGQGKMGEPIPISPQGSQWEGAFKPKSE